MKRTVASDDVAPTEHDGVRLRNRDKVNSVDYRWFIVRTLPHQEEKLAGMLRQYLAKASNILEVYCPTHTTVGVVRRGKGISAPLFAGHVFVLSTQQALTDFIDRHYPEGIVLYERKKEKGKKASVWTIPESQMRAFMDFNENYADQVIVLERPYADYAFNPKTNEPNEIVKVIDGPLKGREGYLTRFNRERRLVFNMKSLGTGRYFAVSVPNAWSLKVIRLHNAENDRQTIGTQKERAADLLIGLIEGCGYGDDTLAVFHEIIGYLAITPTLVGLCKYLFEKGRHDLSRKIARLDADGVEQILNLVRYENDNPGYIRNTWRKLVIRPFLTPTAGVETAEGGGDAELRHAGFTEIIRRVDIAEQTYYPSKGKAELTTTSYYAHIGVAERRGGGGFVVFANWDMFLDEYFHTSGKANERLVEGRCKTVACGGKDKLAESFRNFAPTLYNILTDGKSIVKPIRNFLVGKDTLNVFAVTTTCADAEETEKAKATLINTCVNVCKEINSTVHLAVWRRYLRTVWLHV